MNKFVLPVSLHLTCTGDIQSLTLGAHAHEGYSTLSVCLSACLFVCYQSPGFFSRSYDKLDIPACSSLVFLGFQLTDLDKTVSFGR